ncbi:response regulator transcription factor [Ramlibacter sp.]|uniref:response regulator transcription factor n=1 Tax=Ramlibacter sp. TaxID=1917967 RepID=UPI0026298025|nr:response regulator transcription factor [Ramlibacter sp.]MDB5953670.1 putative response regulator, NarL [Ramlibacter sp.]
MKPTDKDSETITVVLADDHDLVRSGIKALLATMPGVQVIGEARDGNELLALLHSRAHPDVVISDLAMPGLDGLAAIRRIKERYPTLRVLVLSMHDSMDFVKRAVESGANGYIMKDGPPEDLERALRTLKSDGSFFAGKVVQRLLQRQEPTANDELTERQVEILTMLARGLSSKEIGFELGLSPKTIDVHRARIMQRLALSDVASLTRYAVRKGLIEA